ncbi:aminotransferase class I/II-fold pyridoxal phosphate-dependent enzyme [soil metagenome]|nr:aminotransferase class I/II-fold pyridoxal phosphate-dependent enzyme [Acidobacteriota bacterium]
MKRIYLSPPDVGPLERELLLDAFDSNWIAPLGPHVDAFEREFADIVGVPYAVALSTGTGALHLGLAALGVGRGDEVVTSTLTFAATANAITYVGATPVFIDAARDSWTMDVDLLEEELAVRGRAGRLPAAVLAVDLYGQCCDYERLLAVCESYGVPVIEDAAEALGAACGTRQAGAFGACAAFSFNGNKIITTGGGGMLVSHSKALIDRVRHLATQARDPAPHYEHSEIGYNYRLSNLLAAVGRGQLVSLDRKIERRRAIRQNYQASLRHLPGVEFLPEAHYGRSNAWLTCITIDARLLGATSSEIRVHLESHDIETRPVWKPMHLQPVYRDCPVRGGRVAAELFHTGLCLPSGSGLTPAEQANVVAAIADVPRHVPPVLAGRFAEGMARV